MSWTCPECGKSFRNPNQWHSCHILDLGDHLRHKPQKIQALVYDLLAQIETFGPIELNPVKSAIQVKAGATFLSIKPKSEYIELEFQLGQEIDQFPVHRTVRISRNRALHFMNIDSDEDINDQLIAWLRDSYHLVRGA